MKEKEKFIEALNTLFYSWGGDTPPEVFWGGNDLLEWYEAEYGISLDIKFDELNPGNFDDVIKEIRRK